MVLSYDRRCAEIVHQAELLAAAVRGADPSTPVPSCPGWNVGQLLRHLGNAQRWAEATVRARATVPVPEDDFDVREFSAYSDEDAEELGTWLVSCAAALAGTLREAGAGTAMWTPVAGGGTSFYARRFTHETALHRADAALAVGADYVLDRDVALDAVDEWMELSALPELFEIDPGLRELPGPGRTLHFHATDTPPEARAEWVVDLTGTGVEWRRAHEKSAVAVRAPLTDLLLLIYKRRPAHGEGVDVFGDPELLDFWLDRVSFG